MASRAGARGGDKMARELAKIADRMKRAKLVKIGFLEGSTYPKRSRGKLRGEYAARKAAGKKGAVRGASSGTATVPMVAAIQNFGAPRAGIPPRPFFSNMVAEKKGEWPEAIRKLFLATNYDAKKTLELTGEAIAGQLRESIIKTNSPPLAPATVKRKGFDKPLIDTSHMINSVDYEVD